MTHKKGTPEYQALLSDPSLIDASLHPIGIEQCLNSQSEVNQFNYSIVYTSPLRRALETTLHMFKNHPNKDKIKFIVLPMAAETMNSASDIGSDVNELQQQYKDQEIQFDFSMINDMDVPQLWQTGMIENQPIKEMILRDLTWQLPNYTDHTPGLTKIFQQIMLGNLRMIDTMDSQGNKTHKMLCFLNEQAKQLKDDEKIGVVTHFNTIASLTAKGVDVEHKLGISDYVQAQNGQNIPLEKF